MAEGDKIIYEGRLDQTDTFLREMAADLRSQASEMRAVGQQAVADVKEAQAAMYEGMAVNPEKVAAGTEELVKQRDLLKEIQQTELFTLEELERTNAVYEQRAAILDRLEAKHRAYAGQQGALFGEEQPPLRERILGGGQPMVQPALNPEWRAQLEAERAAEAEVTRQLQEQTALRERNARLQAQQAEVANWLARGERIGGAAASRGYLVPESARQSLIAGPERNPMWGAAQQQLMRYNLALGEYNALARESSLSTQSLSANMTRLGMVEAESSNALRRHGALTTEYLQSLARGETTVSEFGYQIGATIGKFAGWTAAAALVYGAIGALTEFVHGATDASSAAQQLQRTITGIDPSQAIQAINRLSSDTNVSVKEAGDAVFQYSRVFHTLGDAALGAKDGLAVLKLDNVSLTDSVALSTGIFQQWGRTADQQLPIWNMLAAGQREYNARISQTTTIIRGTQAAVRAAGGDLNQLVQLAVVGAERLPGAPGQIATALSRSATTYARQNLGLIQTEFGIGRGMNQGNYNFTQLFDQAIRLSGSGRLDANKLDELRRLFFDQRLAARVGAAYLSPQGAAGLAQASRTITPQTTEGKLYEELGRQTATFHERMEALRNEIQRAGATFGSSGIVNILSGVADGAVHVSAAMRGLIDTFDLMPNTFKEVVEGAVAARLAFLALTRTRFGASVLDAAGLADNPLFRGRARGTLDRGELRVGTRAALDTTTADLTRTNTKLLQNSEQMAVIKARQAEVDAEIGSAQAAGLRADAETLEESNRLNAQIIGLMTQQTELEIQRNAQEKVQLDLKGQLYALSTANRDARLTDSEVTVLRKQTGQGTTGALGGSTRGEVRQAAEAQKAQLAEQAAQAEKAAGTQTASLFSSAGVQARWAASQARMAAVWSRLTGAELAGAAATTGATVAADEATVAMSANAARILAYTGAEVEATIAVDADAVAMRGMAAATAGFMTSMGGLLAAMDPLLLALIALPFAISEVSGLINTSEAAGKRVHDSVRAQYAGNVAQQLQTLASTYKEDRRKQDTTGIRGLAHGLLAGISQDAHLGIASPTVTGSNPLTDATRNLARHLNDYANSYRKDAESLLKTDSGRAKLSTEMKALERAGAAGLHTALAKQDPKTVARYVAGWYDWLHSITESARLANAHTKPTQLDFLAGLSDTGLQRWSQAYSSRAQVFGLQKGDMSGAIGAYLTMAARYRNSSDPKQMQALATAESSVTQAVSKSVQGLVNASKTAGSYGGAMRDLSGAMGGVSAARAQIRKWVQVMQRTWGNVPGIMKAVNQAARDAQQQLDGYVNGILQQQLQNIQTQSELAASRIPGRGPTADIRRARTIVGGLRQQRRAALKAHDWQTAANLEAQINNQNRDIQGQVVDNANQLADTNSQIAAAQILPISPEAQIKAAQVVLARAKQKLAQDRARHADQLTIAQDYLAMLQSQDSLNMDIRQNADAIFDANQQLAVSSITGVGPGADLARANQVIANARSKLGHDIATGKGKAQQITDQAQINDSVYSLNQLLVSQAQQTAQDAQALVQARASLQEAGTLDPVTAAKEQLAADVKVLSLIKPSGYKTYTEYLTAYTQQQSKIATDRRDITQQYVDTQMSTLEFELHTQQITDQEYVAGLERLLKNAKLSKQERQQIQQAIYDTEHAAAVNLNVGNIRVPTSYEVRRAIAAAARRGRGRIPQNTGTVINHQVSNRVTVNMTVHKDADIRKVAKVFDDTINGNLTGQAQAAGLI